MNKWIWIGEIEHVRQGMHLECSVKSTQSQLLEVGLEVFLDHVFEKVFASQCISEETFGTIGPLRI